MLRDAGYQVVAVSEGQGALQALSDDPTIGVILLDLDMPGVDGVAVRRAQLADPELATIPTVIISGAGGGRVNRGELQADAYLPKPFSRQQLLAVVGRYCTPEPRQES